MKLSEAARVLAKAAAFDARTIGEADVAAWAEALADTPLDVALDAVTRHFRDSESRLMPVHVLDHAADIVAEREAAEREARAQRMRAETLAILGPPPERITSDRSAQLLAQLRRVLPTGDAAKLRGPVWRSQNPGLRPAARRRDDEGPTGASGGV